MKTFVVTITETLVKNIITEAEDEQDACEKVQNAYYNEDIVLDSSNFLDYEIDVNEADENAASAGYQKI